MKNIKTALLILTSLGLIGFMLSGGIDWLSEKMTLQSILWMLYLTVGGIFIFTIYGFIRSVKWWKESSKYRQTLKKGDEVVIGTYKATVIGIENSEVTVSLKIDKNSIYKP